VKKKIWWEEETVAAEAGLPTKYESLNERTRVSKPASQNGYWRGRGNSMRHRPRRQRRGS
jgi:hypothetical protein